MWPGIYWNLPSNPSRTIYKPPITLLNLSGKLHAKRNPLWSLYSWSTFLLSWKSISIGLDSCASGAKPGISRKVLPNKITKWLWQNWQDFSDLVIDKTEQCKSRVTGLYGMSRMSWGRWQSVFKSEKFIYTTCILCNGKINQILTYQWLIYFFKFNCLKKKVGVTLSSACHCCELPVIEIKIETVVLVRLGSSRRPGLRAIRSTAACSYIHWVFVPVLT